MISETSSSVLLSCFLQMFILSTKTNVSSSSFFLLSFFLSLHHRSSPITTKAPVMSITKMQVFVHYVFHMIVGFTFSLIAKPTLSTYQTIFVSTTD